MARRRLRRAVSGLGTGMADFAAALLNDRLQTRRQLAQQEATARGQEVSSFNTDINQMMSPENVGKYGPQVVRSQYQQRRRQLSPQAQARLGAEPDFASMEPPVATRLAPARRRIAEASNPAAVPSEGELGMLFNEARVPTEFDMLGLRGSGLDIGEALGLDLPKTADFQGMAEEAGRKRDELEIYQPWTKVTDYSTGIARDTYRTPREMARTGEVAGERTPGQEATRQGQIRSATAQAEQDVTNDPRNVRGFATREEAVNFARQRGQLRADASMGAGSFTPKVEVKEETDNQGRRVYRLITVQPQSGSMIDRGVIESPNYAGEVTQGQADAAAFANRAVDAHNRMLQLEPVLAQRGFLVNLATMNQPFESFQDPVLKNYVQAARVYINGAQGRPDSGGAITEEEWKTYGSQVQLRPGDDPTILANKQNDRRRSFESLKIKAGPRLGSRLVSMDEVNAMVQQFGGTVEDKVQELEASGYRVYR